jgi:hypothetical protein
MSLPRAALHGDEGMTTAEYAVGTVAACGFAGLLLKLLTSPEIRDLLQGAVRHAFAVIF